MNSLAFAPAISLCRNNHRLYAKIETRVSRPSTVKRRFQRKIWHASQNRDSERSGIPADDEILNKELQKKVNELFGGRQNVKIEMEQDSSVQFTVRNRGIGSSYDETKAAWTVIGSITAFSLVVGIIFTIMFYSGAVHGSDQDDRRYDMPTYGKSSFINPYELLDEDREFQDAQMLPDY